MRNFKLWFRFYFGGLGRVRLGQAWDRIAALEQSNSKLKADLAGCANLLESLASEVNALRNRITEQPAVEAMPRRRVTNVFSEFRRAAEAATGKVVNEHR